MSVWFKTSLSTHGINVSLPPLLPYSGFFLSCEFDGMNCGFLLLNSCASPLALLSSVRAIAFTPSRAGGILPSFTFSNFPEETKNRRFPYSLARQTFSKGFLNVSLLIKATAWRQWRRKEAQRAETKTTATAQKILLENSIYQCGSNPLHAFFASVLSAQVASCNKVKNHTAYDVV